MPQDPIPYAKPLEVREPPFWTRGRVRRLVLCVGVGETGGAAVILWRLWRMAEEWTGRADPWNAAAFDIDKQRLPLFVGGVLVCGVVVGVGLFAVGLVTEWFAGLLRR